MIRRLLPASLGLLVAIGAARADEPRYVPAAGTTLTYRMTIATRIRNTITSGQIYTYFITASDGATAEGTITPTAMIYGCTEGAAMTDCSAALKTPDAERDGDFVIAPVPDQLGGSLARQSTIKLRLFLVEERKAAIPALKRAEAGDSAGFGPDTSYVQVNALRCDPTALQEFVPFGHAPVLSLACTQRSARIPGPGSKAAGFDHTDDLTVELADNGAGAITTPSGRWNIRKIGMKQVPTDPKLPTTVGEIAFSERLGVTVRTHTTTDSVTRPNEFVIDADSELIAIKP